MLIRKLLLFTLFCLAGSAHAISVDEANAISSGETDARIAALNMAVARADAGTAVFLQALADDAVKLVRGQAIMVKDDKGIDPATGAEFVLPDDAEDVINNNRMRGEIDSALAALKLFSKDDKVRMAAVQQMQSDADPSKLTLIEQALKAEQNPKIKDQLALVRAAALLGSKDKAQRLEAAALLGSSNQSGTKTILLAHLQTESDATVKAALGKALREVESRLAWGDKLGAVFSGISLGSILLLVALHLPACCQPQNEANRHSYPIPGNA